jgi:predicted double-glycine peptidase
MKPWTGWAIAAAGIVLLLAVPAAAELRPLSDEELDTILAGQVRTRVRDKAPAPVETTDVSLALAGQRVTRTVQSYKAIRQQGVVLQKLDFSCGAAALSTVFTSFFQKPVQEEEVIAHILVTGQTPKEGLQKYFRRRGFTLLDLKRAAGAMGYQGTGYRGMAVEDLVETLVEERVPILVPIVPLGYYHYVVVRGIQGDRMLLSDPAIGQTTMKIAQFENVWVDGIGFVVNRPGGRAKGNGPLLASADPSSLILPVATAAPPGSNGNGSDPASGGQAPPTSNSNGQTGEAVPKESGLIPIVDRSLPRDKTTQSIQTFLNAQDRRVVTYFNLPNYNAAVQFGQPAGNFIDFTPRNGPISTGSTPSQ